MITPAIANTRSAYRYPARFGHFKLWFKAVAYNDRQGITEPVDRRFNVLSWMWCYYRDHGDLDMALQMKEEYHQLRHADPSIQAICGICEYQTIV